MSGASLRLLWQQIPSPLVSEILCAGGNINGIVLDLEHGIFNAETTYTCIQVIQKSKKKCFIRLSKDYMFPQSWLDSGVDGLIFSTIENQMQASHIMDNCLFAPSGKRGLGLVRQNFWGEKDLMAEPPILIAQIETRVGSNNIYKLADFGFDYFMIGPYDLSLSLGCPGNFEAPEYVEALHNVRDAVGDKLGYHIVKDIERQLYGLNGCKFLAFGLDTIMLIDGVKQIDSMI